MGRLRRRNGCKMPGMVCFLKLRLTELRKMCGWLGEKLVERLRPDHSIGGGSTWNKRVSKPLH